MLRSHHKRISLGIGLKDLTVVDARNLHVMSTLQLSDYLSGSAMPQAADWAPAIQAALAHADLPGGDVVLTISDAWARYFTLQIPDGVSSLAELHALAAGRFETLFGSAMTGWSLEADWKVSGTVLVCCVPSRLVDAALTLSAAGAWRVRSVLPYAVRLQSLFCGQIPDEGWVCFYARHSVVAMLVKAGETAYVRRFPVESPLTAAGIGSLLAAESMRIGVESPESLCALGILPRVPEDGVVGGMKLVLGRGSKLAGIRPAEMSESQCMARQGAIA